MRAGHFNLPATIDNVRSGENGILPDADEYKLLELDLWNVEVQDDATVDALFQAAQRYPDTFADGYRSLKNSCHQLRSLSRLWSLLSRFDPRPDDVVLLLRPDLRYLDALDVERDLGVLTCGHADLVVPRWQSWGGLNDRFAFCNVHAARAYANRMQLFSDACDEMRGMHAETFLAFTAVCHGLRVALTDMRALRVRADGRIAGNDVSMLAAGPRCGRAAHAG